MVPWETRTESVASKKQIDLTAQPLIEIIDAEAKRFRETTPVFLYSDTVRVVWLPNGLGLCPTGRWGCS